MSISCWFSTIHGWFFTHRTYPSQRRGRDQNIYWNIRKLHTIFIHEHLENIQNTLIGMHPPKVQKEERTLPRGTRCTFALLCTKKCSMLKAFLHGIGANDDPNYPVWASRAHQCSPVQLPSCLHPSSTYRLMDPALQRRPGELLSSSSPRMEQEENYSTVGILLTILILNSYESLPIAQYESIKKWVGWIYIVNEIKRLLN